MTTRYEVVPAKTAKEAKENSVWKVGQLARIVSVEVIANTNKTFTVFPICEPVEE